MRTNYTRPDDLLPASKRFLRTLGIVREGKCMGYECWLFGEDEPNGIVYSDGSVELEEVKILPVNFPPILHLLEIWKKRRSGFAVEYSARVSMCHAGRFYRKPHGSESVHVAQNAVASLRLNVAAKTSGGLTECANLFLGDDPAGTVFRLCGGLYSVIECHAISFWYPSQRAIDAEMLVPCDSRRHWLKQGDGYSDDDICARLDREASWYLPEMMALAEK